MTREYGRFIVSFALLIILHSWKESMNFRLSCRSPLKMKGGFPLSAPLALLAMTFILGGAAPVAVFISVGCSVIAGSVGSTAVTGGISTGMLIPWDAVRLISRRMGSWGESGWVPWSVAMWWTPPSRRCSV